MTIPETVVAKKIGVFGLLILVTMVFSGISGCGYKTMPVPPEEVVPKAVTDLRYELDRNGVTLKWTYPRQTLRGDELTGIVSFKLFRAVVPVDTYCDTCPIPFGEPIMVEGGGVVQAAPKTAEYKTTLLRPGHLYFFKVRSAAGWWADSGDSNIVSFMWDVPPAAPQKIEASVADRSVTVRWQPVTRRIDDTKIKEDVKYQVLRNSGSGAFAPIGQLVSDIEFIDNQVANTKVYQYKVQAVVVYEKGQVGGGASSMVEAVPVDQTPPSIPAGVEGIRTASSVKIIWERVNSADLKGYRVYRRLPDAATPVKIGEVGADSIMFDDGNPPQADSWYYSVTSIDSAQPANESEPSAEVNVRF